MAAAVSPLSLSAMSQSSTGGHRRYTAPSTKSSILSFSSMFRSRFFSFHPLSNGVNSSSSSSSSSSNRFTSRLLLHCSASASTDVPPTVSETKLNFLKAYNRPIPSIYNNVLQELIVQHHLMRYKKSYKYDAVFALGFVTVYDRLMEGYPSDADRDSIFQAYVNALKEDPEKYRADAQKLEEWASGQTSTTLLEFSSKEGEVEGILKDISERARNKGNFSYSRFFAIGLFRLLELANATDPTILEKLCAALNVDKKSVDRDLDVYRNLLTKLVQAKELLKEYVEREKKKREERAGSEKANEAVKNCVGEYDYVGRRL